MIKKSVIDLLDEDEFEQDDDLDQEIKEDLEMIESFKKELFENQKAQRQEHGLQTIVEAADESQQSLQNRLEYIQDDESQISIPVMLIEDESPQKQLYKFKEYAKKRGQEKQRVEKQFQTILKQQKEHLMKEYKETEIMRKLEKQIKPSQLQQTVQELLRQNLILSAESFQQEESPKQQQQEQVQDKNRKIQISNKVSCKCEQYIKEIQDYKTRVNEFEDTIKILKVQIKKMEQQQASFNNSSTSTQASKTDKLQEQNESLKQEIVQMKVQFTQERDQLKSEIQRAKRIQSAVQQQKQVQLTEKQINELEKIKVEKTQLECQLRNLQKETQDQIQQLQKEIKDLKKKEQTLPTPPQKLLKSAEEKYQQQIEKLEKQIQQIKQNYSLDNQINLLFPTTYNHILYIMNIFNKLEQLDNSKDVKIFLFGKLLQIAKPYFLKLIYGLNYFKQSLIYLFTKKKIDHPSHQEIIQKAIKMIRASPTTLEEEIIKLKTINKQLSDERDELKDKSNKLQGELEQKNQTYSRLDELVSMDKYDLVNRLMNKILTQEIQDKTDGVSHTEFDQIKEYCKLIIQSAPIQVIYQKVEVEKEVEPKKDTKQNKCTHQDRHQKRNQIPIKSQYYNK